MCGVYVWCVCDITHSGITLNCIKHHEGYMRGTWGRGGEHKGNMRRTRGDMGGGSMREHEGNMREHEGNMK